MASTTIVKVKVQELTKYGFKANDKFVNYSKQFKDQAMVVPGAAFEAEYYISDGGKEYLNKILSNSVVSSFAPAINSEPKADTQRAKKFTPKFNKPVSAASDSEKMSKADWSAKDRSQLIGGLSHDAAAITAALVACTSVEDPLKLYKSLLEGMLKIREEVK